MGIENRKEVEPRLKSSKNGLEKEASGNWCFLIMRRMVNKKLARVKKMKRKLKKKMIKGD